MGTTFLITFIVIFFALVPISMLVESMRKKPVAPTSLEWAPDISIQYINIDGINTRYIKTGEGPPLVLLHTLRTQLDIFQKVIPALSKDFTVYAFDYPGHGWSDIPDTNYTPDLFNHSVTEFLEKMNLNDILVAGVSIGGTIPLMMVGGGNKRIKAIVSVNPYDYKGQGAARGNFIARLIFTMAYVPILGETFMRFRNTMVEGKIMEGGVSTASALPEAFLEEVFVVGERPGHYQAFINLIRHSSLFQKAHELYNKINVPVLLVYGDRDWSKESERKKTASGINDAIVETVKDGGHFLTLDQPEAFTHHVQSFAKKLGILS